MGIFSFDHHHCCCDQIKGEGKNCKTSIGQGQIRCCANCPVVICTTGISKVVIVNLSLRDVSKGITNFINVQSVDLHPHKYVKMDIAICGKKKKKIW